MIYWLNSVFRFVNVHQHRIRSLAGSFNLHVIRVTDIGTDYKPITP